MNPGTGTRSNTGSRKSKSRKVKLSFLVLRYLQEGRYTYATILALAATRPVSRREMLQLAALLGEDLDVTTLKSWLHYQTIRGYLEKTGIQGMYRIGPAIEPDINEVRKILQEYDIDLDELDKQLLRRGKLLQQLLDQEIRNVIEQILYTISSTRKVKMYYLVQCKSKRYLIPVEAYGLKRLNDKVIDRDQECTIIGICIVTM